MCFKGSNDSGKSEKIKNLANWIIDNYTPDIKSVETFARPDAYGVLEIGNLKIGFNGAGDNLDEVKRTDKLIRDNGDNIDIIICACRTRGKGRKHIENNYTYAKGWLNKPIYVENYPQSDVIRREARDSRIMNELKAWLIGLEKL